MMGTSKMGLSHHSFYCLHSSFPSCDMSSIFKAFHSWDALASQQLSLLYIIWSLESVSGASPKVNKISLSETTLYNLSVYSDFVQCFLLKGKAFRHRWDNTYHQQTSARSVYNKYEHNTKKSSSLWCHQYIVCEHWPVLMFKEQVSQFKVFCLLI